MKEPMEKKANGIPPTTFFLTSSLKKHEFYNL